VPPRHRHARLGRGGFGIVWEARDRELRRAIAFKALRAPGRARPMDERLLQEAELAASLSQPNIVTLPQRSGGPRSRS
jgi:serine/threonine protein kinase